MQDWRSVWVRTKMCKLCHLREWIWITWGVMPILQHSRACHTLVWNSFCLIKAKAPLPKGVGRKTNQPTNQPMKNSALFLVDLHRVQILKKKIKKILQNRDQIVVHMPVDTYMFYSTSRLYKLSQFALTPREKWSKETHLNTLYNHV